MVVVAFPVMDELMSNLHHPVRAALRVRHHEDVLRAWHVVPEGIVLPQALVLPVSEAAHEPDRCAPALLHLIIGRMKPSIISPMTICAASGGGLRLYAICFRTTAC